MITYKNIRYREKSKLETYSCVGCAFYNMSSCYADLVRHRSGYSTSMSICASQKIIYIKADIRGILKLL